jgi:hypothetical protein
VIDRYQEFRQRGSEVLAISFAPPSVVAAYVGESAAPFPVLSDQSKTAYQDFGLEHTSWRQILQGSVLGRYLGLILRGWLPRKSRRGEDYLQLGGDFILDSQRRLVNAHRSAEPTDRPTVEELLHAVEAVRDR